MGPIAWLTILHTYFIGLFHNFSVEPKIKGQMYKEVKGEGGRKRKKVKVMNRGVCVCRMMAGKGNQGDRKCIYIHVGHM